MRPDFACCVALAVLGLLLGAGPQDQPAARGVSNDPAKKTVETKAPRKQLAPQQDRALRLLKAAEAEAASLQPEMRTYLLWQISRGYEKAQPAKADSLLKAAFRASLSVESSHRDAQACTMPETCDLKAALQRGILSEILHRSPEALQSLVLKAEPEVREYITAGLISYYAKREEFNRAEELLNQFTDDDKYPYGAANELMLRLPEERASERLAIFSQALNHFQQHRALAVLRFEDLAGMVLRFWDHLPPSLVMDAIDAILEQAKDQDDSATPMRVGVSTDGGDAYFASSYEFRLFELLPVIEQLDNSKAERLLRESIDVRSALDRYPRGLKTLAPAYYSDKPLAKGEKAGIRSMGFSTGDSTESAITQARMRQEDENNRRLREIAGEAAKDPKQALASALSLSQVGPWGSDYSPRVAALQEVAATAAANGNTSVAKSALDEARKGLDSLSPNHQSSILVEAAQTYIRLKELERAQKTLTEALKIAEKLYARDTDADDPNKAFKGVWPSTNLWRRIVGVAGRISPDLPEEIIGTIPDPEAGTLVKIAYAESLLGLSAGYHSEIEWRKDGVKVLSGTN